MRTRRGGEGGGGGLTSEQEKCRRLRGAETTNSTLPFRGKCVIREAAVKTEEAEVDSGARGKVGSQAGKRSNEHKI